MNFFVQTTKTVYQSLLTMGSGNRKNSEAFASNLLGTKMGTKYQ